jgi:hypothetical protein
VAGAPAWPEAVIVAWFWMRPVIDESTFTWNLMVVEAPMAMVPPVVAVAFVPRRTRTVREPVRYSPWSSPVASVFVPMLAPAVTRIEPGTKVRPAGRGSFKIVFVATSLPLFVPEIVYSIVSPGSTAPAGCAVRSAIVFVAPPKSGLYVEIDVMKAPSR